MKGPRTLLVTLASRTRQVDAVADADVPVRDLVAPLRDLLRLGPEDTALTIARAGDLADGASHGQDPDRTLEELGVLDGDMVVLHAAAEPPSAPGHAGGDGVMAR
jgi:hypothetical protein